MPNNLSFIWDKYSHLTSCFNLIEPNCLLFIVGSSFTEVLLLAGGLIGTTGLSSTELFSPEGTCDKKVTFG